MEYNIPQDVLDDLVVDLACDILPISSDSDVDKAEATASAINNEGYEAQLEYLTSNGVDLAPYRQNFTITLVANGAVVDPSDAVHIGSKYNITFTEGLLDDQISIAAMQIARNLMDQMDFAVPDSVGFQLHCNGEQVDIVEPIGTDYCESGIAVALSE